MLVPAPNFFPVCPQRLNLFGFTSYMLRDIASKYQDKVQLFQSKQAYTELPEEARTCVKMT